MTTTANKAADDDSWKRKYRDSVRELDSRRTEWRESEARLQKSLLRIAFSFLGADAELDAELKRVQASLRKKISVDERARLVDSIASHVTTFTGSKRFTDARADPRAPLQRLLEHLDVPEAYDKEVEILTSRIAECPTDALQDNTDKIIALLNDALAREPADAAETGDGFSDPFVDFLSRISLSGSIGEKISALQERSTRIKSDIERLMVIDDTIALLTEELDEQNQVTRSAAQARAITRELIEWMTLPSQVKDDLKGIQAQLEQATADGELSPILRDLGYTVSQFHSKLASELSDVEYYLKNIAVKLKQLQIGIEESFADQSASMQERETLATDVAEQISAIATTIESEEDLDAVKHVIDEGLQEIGSRMRDHLAQDQERVARGEERLRNLSQRLKLMDEESTRLRAQVRRERNRAQRDALTGIANRAAYDERIAVEVARHDRHERELSLAVIDIDKFKTVNDNLGHKAGDKVLKNVAEICASNVRTSDFLARYGGEEFVLVLPETSLDQAYVVAEKLRGEIEGKGFYYNKRRVPITVSIGIARFADGESADTVFQRADRALYVAKHGGRNRCATENELTDVTP
tara:strand:- start:3492 stop:5246 length:1755 start_codon:yes stop_codon:yes gene_type:complete